MSCDLYDMYNVSCVVVENIIVVVEFYFNRLCYCILVRLRMYYYVHAHCTRVPQKIIDE